MRAELFNCSLCATITPILKHKPSINFHMQVLLGRKCLVCVGSETLGGWNFPPNTLHDSPWLQLEGHNSAFISGGFLECWPWPFNKMNSKFRLCYSQKLNAFVSCIYRCFVGFHSASFSSSLVLL